MSICDRDSQIKSNFKSTGFSQTNCLVTSVSPVDQSDQYMMSDKSLDILFGYLSPRDDKLLESAKYLSDFFGLYFVQS